MYLIQKQPYSPTNSNRQRKWIRRVEFAHYGDVQIESVAEHTAALALTQR